jgi:hypothetical protein
VLRRGAQVALTSADFKAAQIDFVPLSLKDIPLQKSTVEWADIGGAGKAGMSLTINSTNIF